MLIFASCAHCDDFFTLNIDYELKISDIQVAAEEYGYELIDDTWYCDSCYEKQTGQKPQTYYDLYKKEQEKNASLQKQMKEDQDLFNTIYEEAASKGKELRELKQSLEKNKRWRFW